MVRITVLTVVLCACRSNLARPPASSPAAPVTRAPADAPPADGPICEPGENRFECDVIEGELIHPEGIVD